MYDTVGTMRQGVMSLLLSVVAICAVTGEVAATDLRKCTWANGRHAYVSSACPEGSREAWLRDVAADPQHEAGVKRRLDDIAQWQQASRRESAARMRPTVQRGGVRAGTDNTSRCERARQRRDRIRDKDWLRMTYDRMIQLDDEVAEACR